MTSQKYIYVLACLKISMVLSQCTGRTSVPIAQPVTQPCLQTTQVPLQQGATQLLIPAIVSPIAPACNEQVVQQPCYPQIPQPCYPQIPQPCYPQTIQPFGAPMPAPIMVEESGDSLDTLLYYLLFSMRNRGFGGGFGGCGGGSGGCGGGCNGCGGGSGGCGGGCNQCSSNGCNGNNCGCGSNVFGVNNCGGNNLLGNNCGLGNSFGNKCGCGGNNCGNSILPVAFPFPIASGSGLNTGHTISFSPFTNEISTNLNTFENGHVGGPNDIRLIICTEQSNSIN